ncbi:GNAT family N-acetyltransferase [Varunaivibrio sulfuroxidans]|uniref:Acetyltransferase (GNAT) family protein n=1 Tax=Varunaivibrio sulfuroxidans TaxID=1773489 RepID=A0A4R3JAI8_9PROT|nr:GNAT family N-acetyltransferase [Varunaivibrio sulfuroxidans]TCS62999.1 acetyltransferase (GNAT) family protein [Varunaivibrio sulfuroxidans]WES31923.1 GNAT family N-acetyltransferase [Varunaivibrio sulfuroxidans]
MTLRLLDTEELNRHLSRGVDAAAFPAWDGHPLFGAFTRALYPNVAKLVERHRICSFAVADGDDRLLAIVPCTASEDGITHYGLPIVPAIARDLAPKVERRAVACALDHLEALARTRPTPSAFVLGRTTADAPDALEDACLARLARPGVRIHAVADLGDGEEALHRGLRKSFRSLVNWGRDNLLMTYVNADTPDRTAFDAFCAFHARVSGGQTYPDSYWEVFWNAIAAGNGELSLAALKDGPPLVCATYSVSAGKTGYYASGVYDRDLFDKPLAHFPVFDAMVRAARRGIGAYDLGEIVPRGAGAPDKDVRIGFFKKGFVARCRLTLTWTLHAPPPS